MTDIDAGQSSAKSERPWALIFAATFLGAIGVGVIGVTAHGFLTGWMQPHWSALTDPQAAVLTNFAAIYAAGFAATIVPLIFRGQIDNLEKASEEAIDKLRDQFTKLADEQKRSSERVLDIAEQSKASLSVLQNYALHTMGFVERFAEEDLPAAKGIIQQFQDKAVILCQSALHNSNKWSTTKSQFDRMWPGRTNYVNKLFEHSIISEPQRDMFLQIAESYRFTRERNPDQVDLATLNVLNKTVRELEESFRSTE